MLKNLKNPSCHNPLPPQHPRLPRRRPIKIHGKPLKTNQPPKISKPPSKLQRNPPHHQKNSTRILHRNQQRPSHQITPPRNLRFKNHRQRLGHGQSVER